MDSDQEIIIDQKSVDCQYHTNESQECFRKIIFKNDSYNSEDFIYIRNCKRKELGQIICFFIDESLKFKAVIRKYVFAWHYEPLFKSKGYTFDENNEVLQDMSKLYVIDVTDISKKCNLVVLTLDDDPFYVRNAGLDVTLNYSLRFKLHCNKLYPVIMTHSDEVAFESTRKASPNKGAISKVKKQPVDPNCDVEMGATGVTSKRNSVKRDLRSSFADVENYIIVSDDDDEDSLNIRLRKSSTLRNTEIRKSSRRVPRKSYADYESPKKINKKYEDEDDDKPHDSPTKQLLQEISNIKLDSPTKRTDIKQEVFSTPRRSQRIKRTLSFRGDPENDHLSTSPNKIIRRTPGSKRSVTCHESDESDYSLKSPPKRASRRSRKVDPPVSSNNSRKHDPDSSSKAAETDSGTAALRVNLENLFLSDTEQSSPSKNTKKKISSTKIKTGLSSSSSDNDHLPSQLLQTSSSDECVPTLKLNRSKPSATPRNTIRLIREGQITPSMQTRTKAVKSQSTPYVRVRRELHVSHVPRSLPCREKEYSDIYQFLKGKLLDRSAGCMYIAGVPGTGKTATVMSVIANLKKDKKAPECSYIHINAMKLTEPRQAYVEIIKQLTGKFLPWEQAQNTLIQTFLKSKMTKPVIIVVDELDILCTRNQNVVYNLLDWPCTTKNPLIVVTIANTMDLPERILKNKNSSRMGLTRLAFQAYTYKQLQEIITKRLSGLVGFNPDAIQFVARKVAAVSGDARRALDICRLATEIAERDVGISKLDMKHVGIAVSTMLTQPKVQAIKYSSQLEQLVLKSMVAEVERTGIEETTFSDLYKMLGTVCALDGFPMVSQTVALLALSRLGSYKLIITDPKCNDIHQRIVLNVNVDDVYYALRKPLNPNEFELEPLG